MGLKCIYTYINNLYNKVLSEFIYLQNLLNHDIINIILVSHMGLHNLYINPTLSQILNSSAVKGLMVEMVSWDLIEHI